MFTISNINFERIREDVSRRISNFFKWVSPDSKPLSVAGYFEEIDKARKSGFNNLHDYFSSLNFPGETEYPSTQLTRSVKILSIFSN